MLDRAKHCGALLIQLWQQWYLIAPNGFGFKMVAETSQWQSLITHRGSRDTCDGVQLLLTALLGQTYALLSKVRCWIMMSSAGSL